VALLEPIFEALNRAQVRYVVVGGVAMVLHGFARFTADLDLAVDLSPPEARKAVETLVGLGFRPRAPVDAVAFANPEARIQWFRDKAMRVFALWDPTNPMRQVDLFIRNPIDFGLLWTHAEIMDVGVTSVRVAAIADLIEMKRIAGRPQDLADIEALEAIRKRRESGNV